MLSDKKTIITICEELFKTSKSKLNKKKVRHITPSFVDGYVHYDRRGKQSYLEHAFFKSKYSENLAVRRVTQGRYDMKTSTHSVDSFIVFLRFGQVPLSIDKKAPRFLLILT